MAAAWGEEEIRKPKINDEVVRAIIFLLRPTHMLPNIVSLNIAETNLPGHVCTSKTICPQRVNLCGALGELRREDALP